MGLEELDFVERSESFREAVLTILRCAYGDSDYDIHTLVATEVELMYTDRENELMKCIRDYINEELKVPDESA